MLANAREAQTILAERLEDTPEAIAIDALLDITKLGADRTGFGPASRTTNVHVHVGLADRLKTARERAKVIEHAPLAPEPAPAAYHSQQKAEQ